MAEKRMFSKTITESDAFLDMPLSTQALYFHLCMHADDDGFLSGYRKIMRMVGASQDEYNILIGKKFLIEFDDGIVVIKHWLMHNYLRKDRYKPTSYTKEKSLLFVKDNKSYTLDNKQGEPLGTPHGIPMVDVDKSSIDKSSIDNIVQIDSFFEECWRMYPRKEGKGKVSKTQKKKLYNLGAEFKNCISRYTKAKKGQDKQYLQMGSTFFNSGYIDYLDENYEPQTFRTEPVMNKKKVTRVEN